MNLKTVQQKFNTQHKCLKYLEKLRWNGKRRCPYCNSRDSRANKGEPGRYACRNCDRSFSVFVDTIFEDTRLPLPDWFQIITLILNSKSGISAKEIQRNTGVSLKTAYYTAMRVRIAMLEPCTCLDGLIEMDESYFGGKVRRIRKHLPSNSPSLSSVTNKRGRGTNKVSVAGMVERKGEVKTKVIEKLTKRNLLAMLKTYASKDGSIVVTDGFKSYNGFDKHIEHLKINHSKQWSKGLIHINSIEGFWSYVKNGIRGNYKAISKKYLPFYLVEYEWKYNHRKYKGDEFNKLLKNALSHEKELEYWKAKDSKQVKEVAYGR